MLKDLNFKEVVEFFKEIPDNQMGNVKKAQIYALAFGEQERRAKEETINNDIKGSSRRKIVNTTIVSEDIAIVETIENWGGENQHIFRPIVKGNTILEVTNTFDYALILALSNKYKQGNHAPSMIYNMLRMDDFELKEDEDVR